MKTKITFGMPYAVSDDGFSFEIVGETSVFSAGNHAQIRMFPSDTTAELTVSAGSAVFVKRGEILEMTEYLIFAKSDSGRTEYPVARIISADWQGRNCGPVTAFDDRVNITEPESGVLKIVYETTFDLIDAVCPIGSHCLLEAQSDTRYGYADLDFTYGMGDGTVEVVLQVRDACTNAKLPDAEVFINGQHRGVTDQNAYVNLGYLNPGTYAVRVIKEGYQDSDKDIIANDSFVIE